MSQPPAGPGLKPLDAALADLLAFAQPLASQEAVAIFDADGRVLAQAVVSDLQVPPQDNSSMDGYALFCADAAQAGAQLPVSQRIAAGSSGQPLRICRVGAWPPSAAWGTTTTGSAGRIPRMPSA